MDTEAQGYVDSVHCEKVTRQHLLARHQRIKRYCETMFIGSMYCEIATGSVDGNSQDRSWFS